MRKFVSIEKLPSGHYSVRHWHGDKFEREWFSDYGAAKHRAAALTLTLEALRQGLPDPAMRPIDIYDKYIDAMRHELRESTLRIKADHAKTFFEGSQHITETRIKEYKNSILGKLAISTVSIKLREIRSICNWAKKEGYIQEDVFVNIEVPAAEETGKRLELEDVKRIWLNADTCFKSYLGFLVYTGARYTEIRLTKWTDLDLERGVWHIPGSNCKTGKERYIPLDPKLLNVLKMQDRAGEYVFHKWSKNTGRWYLDKACAKVQKADPTFTDDKWPTPHTYRHTFASFWEGDIRDLMDMCGWTTMMMPKRYTHNSTEDLRKEAAKKGISSQLSI